ncbi:2Fe-2S iron-sulfur cluster-binding protein [Roseibium salinum]|nr:2Fe-2S iron-sulfur cluster-binding protein [Roseibium salinum]
MLTILWPDSALTQSILLLVVWSHAMIGLHFWLRLYPAYRRLRIVAAGFAIAVPVLALWGWIEGARRLALTRDVAVKITPEQQLWAAELVAELRAFVLSLIAISLLIVLMRYLSQRFTSGIAVTYPGGLKVNVSPGPTLLEISRMKNIPHAAVCGGRARCSTCRVKNPSRREPARQAGAGRGGRACPDRGWGKRPAGLPGPPRSRH